MFLKVFKNKLNKTRNFVNCFVFMFWVRFHGGPCSTFIGSFSKKKKLNPKSRNVYRVRMNRMS